MTTEGRLTFHGRYRGLGSVLPLLCQVGLIASFAAAGLRPLSDADLGWHLRTGQLIVHHGFTTTDPWSFASTQPWILHEWGGEVIMYTAYVVGGYTGIIALRVLLMTLLAYLIIRACRQESGNWVALGVASLAFLSLWSRATERPQLISFCLLAAVLPVLLHQIERDENPWWLPFVIFAWVNVHAMWSVALLFYLALVAGKVLGRRQRPLSEYGPLIVIGVLSGVALLANPDGYHVLQVFRLGGAGFIGEFSTPSLFDPLNVTTTLLAGIVLIHWARSAAVAPPTSIAYALTAMALGATYNRTVPIAAIALAPLAARAIQARMPVPMPGQREPRSQHRDRFAVAALAGACLMAALIKLPGVPELALGTPQRASGHLDALPGRAKVLNEYGLGGWIVWTARDTSPGIDGRSEIYDPTYVSEYLAALRMSDGWEDWVADQPLDAAWLYKATPLTSGLKSLGWSVSRDEGATVILVPPQPAV